MNKMLIAAAACAATVSGAAMAQDFKAGDLLVRARAVHLNSANTDSTGLGLTVNNKTLPEVDFSYFFSKHIAAELILTVPRWSRWSRITPCTSAPPVPPPSPRCRRIFSPPSLPSTPPHPLGCTGALMKTGAPPPPPVGMDPDRKSTRLNSSH